MKFKTIKICEELASKLDILRGDSSYNAFLCGTFDIQMPDQSEYRSIFENLELSEETRMDYSVDLHQKVYRSLKYYQRVFKRKFALRQEFEQLVIRRVK